MASIRQRKGSKYWHACITMPDGKRKQFSTGLADRQEALAAAHAIERATRKETHAQGLRLALDRVVEDFAPEDHQSPGAWLKEWAAARRNEVAASTFANYTHTANEAAAYLEAAGVRSFSDITPRQIKELRDQWAKNRANSTANGKLKVLRIMLGQAVRDGIIKTNPAEPVAALKTAATKRREFRPAEIEALLPTLTGEWRAMFLLGLYTGQRINDLAGLKWSNIDLANRSLAFTAAKTGATVALPLLDVVVDALAELPAGENPDAHVFPRIQSKKKSGRSNEFRALLAKVGLAKPLKHKANQPGRREPAELSFHSLRHTATSMLKAAGVSDSIARAIIGHESAAVSRAYTHLDMETMREAMKKML